MAGGSPSPDLLNQLDILALVGAAGDQSDAHLLRRFLTGTDEASRAALAALVERHGPMVLRACGHILGDAHDAQDAFQATFLVLARKAGSVRKAASVAGWLHGVALRVALRAKADAARRKIHERRVAAMKIIESEHQLGGPESWSELHEEVARLPGRYREPVVLCYLEGLSTEAAALRIGCPRGTVLSRLSRARQQLRGRLTRRGLVFPAAFLAATTGSGVAGAALPAALLTATVRASSCFAASWASQTASNVAVATLAKGVISAMAFSKSKVLVPALLVCIVTLGGIRTFAWQLGGTGAKAGGEPTSEDRYTRLTHSVDELQSGLEESSRRNAEMRRSLQDIRTDLQALHASQRPLPQGTARRLIDLNDADSTRSVRRLADILKRHPARLSPDRGWGYQLYMLDLVEGGTTLIADEPIPDQLCSGMPAWSHDGHRIVFETTGSRWPVARLMAIEARDGRPSFTDLGPGNHPSFSPDDKRIAFFLHPGAGPGAEAGVWLMLADGSDRQRVGESGAPFWSPDGRGFLINSYSLPTLSTVINLETGNGGVVKVPGQEIFSWPSWAGPGTLVSALAMEGKDHSIALLDVREPAETRVIEVLWKRGGGPDVTPRWPAYRPDTRRCFFTGEEPMKRTLFAVERGDSARATRMELVEHQRPGHYQQLGGLSFSPDGRYLLFSANRPAQD